MACLNLNSSNSPISISVKYLLSQIYILSQISTFSRISMDTPFRYLLWLLLPYINFCQISVNTYASSISTLVQYLLKSNIFCSQISNSVTIDCSHLDIILSYFLMPTPHYSTIFVNNLKLQKQYLRLLLSQIIWSSSSFTVLVGYCSKISSQLIP